MQKHSPMATLHGREISAAEWDTRVELAAAFRVAYHLGWNDKITNHITARLPDSPNRFLMNPRGLGWHEITASSLLVADFEGRIHGPEGMAPGPAGLNFHGGILKAKPELNCVLHTHTTAGVVISATKGGLMIVDQSGCQLYGEVAYHDFEGYADEADEVPRILADLGDKNAMIMWNHGTLTVGRTIGEAFAYMRKLIDTCELQERLMATGAEIRPIPKDVLEFIRKQIAKRRGNKIYGEDDWAMYRRLADKLDPSFAT